MDPPWEKIHVSNGYHKRFDKMIGFIQKWMPGPQNPFSGLSWLGGHFLWYQKFRQSWWFI